MFKIRLPYSLFIFLGLTAITTLFIGLFVGALTEALCCGLLLIKLRGAAEFDYESIYGQILSQMTTQGTIALGDIVHISSARVASFVIALGIIWMGFPLIWCLLPAIFFIATTIHY